MDPESAIAEGMRKLRDKYGARARHLGRRQMEAERELEELQQKREREKEREEMARGIEAKEKEGEGTERVREGST